MINGWATNGLKDVESVERYLSQNEKRQHMYRRIFKALGFSRNATEEERKIMDTWFDTMEFSLEKVLSACSKTTGISNPNINYVNKVLKNWYEERDRKGCGRKAERAYRFDITRYYETLRRLEGGGSGQASQGSIRKGTEDKRDRRQAQRGKQRELSRIIISDAADRKQRAERIKAEADTLNTEKLFFAHGQRI